MTNAEVKLQQRYIAKVSGRLVVVEILNKQTLGKGWIALNCATNRRVHIRSAQQLRRIISDQDYAEWLRKMANAAGADLNAVK